MKTRSLIFRNINASLSLLTRKEKDKLLFITIAAAVTSILEVLALMGVFPFLTVLFDPEVLKSNKQFILSWTLLGSPSYENYIFVLASLVSIGLIISTFTSFFVQIILQLSVKKDLGMTYLD